LQAELEQIQEIESDSMFKQLGSIIVADDQLINLEVLKNTLREIRVEEKASYYVNG
jgi:hypothetical protein